MTDTATVEPDEVRLLEVLASARDSIEEVLAGHVDADRVRSRVVWAADRMAEACELAALLYPARRGSLGAFRKQAPR